MNSALRTQGSRPQNSGSLLGACPQQPMQTPFQSVAAHPAKESGTRSQAGSSSSRGPSSLLGSLSGSHGASGVSFGRDDDLGSSWGQEREQSGAPPPPPTGIRSWPKSAVGSGSSGSVLGSVTGAGGGFFNGGGQQVFNAHMFAGGGGGASNGFSSARSYSLLGSINATSNQQLLGQQFGAPQPVTATATISGAASKAPGQSYGATSLLGSMNDGAGGGSGGLMADSCMALAQEPKQQLTPQPSSLLTAHQQQQHQHQQQHQQQQQQHQQQQQQQQQRLQHTAAAPSAGHASLASNYSAVSSYMGDYTRAAGVAGSILGSASTEHDLQNTQQYHAHHAAAAAAAAAMGYPASMQDLYNGSMMTPSVGQAAAAQAAPAQATGRLPEAPSSLFGAFSSRSYDLTAYAAAQQQQQPQQPYLQPDATAAGQMADMMAYGSESYNQRDLETAAAATSGLGLAYHNGDVPCLLVVENLPPSVGVEELKTLFSFSGALPPPEVYIPWPGTARLRFASSMWAQEAIHIMDGRELHGHSIRVYAESVPVE